MKYNTIFAFFYRKSDRAYYLSISSSQSDINYESSENDGKSHGVGLQRQRAVVAARGVAAKQIQHPIHRVEQNGRDVTDYRRTQQPVAVVHNLPLAAIAQLANETAYHRRDYQILIRWPFHKCLDAKLPTNS